MDGLVISPTRMSIANLKTGDVLEAQFNPTEVQESLSVNYNELSVLGLSHQPTQYQSTGNQSFDFELAFFAFDARGNRLDDIAYARRFLQSLCYSSRGAGDVLGGAPPRALFLWPALASLVCTVRSLQTTFQQFNVLDYPVRWNTKVKLVEVRDGRIYSEDVLQSGTERGAGARGEDD